jgi:hypothetical protein
VPKQLPVEKLENHKTLKNSQTVADRRVKQKDTKKPSSVGLSNSDTISDEWRRLLPISSSGPLSRLSEALLTRERWQLDEKCLQNTNSKPGSAYRMLKLLPLGGATYHDSRFRFVFATRKSANDL